MILISKDDRERIVEQFVVKLCENNNSTELATESMDILNDKIHILKSISPKLFDLLDSVADYE